MKAYDSLSLLKTVRGLSQETPDYSGKGFVGYFIVKMNGKKFISQNMPYEIWEGFKNAESNRS